LNWLKKTKEQARSLQQICNALSEELSITLTRHTLRRFLKHLGYSWKRFRKNLKSKQNKEEYNRKLTELQQLLELHKSKSIDLFFADESSFNLEGYVPYGWQPKNEYIHITPAKTKSKNIFGIMSLDNRLEAYDCQGSMTSEVIIAFINNFCQKIKQPTVLVLDNAPIHHSNAFKQKIEAWKEQDLYIFFLPTYSPHLNPIEILWRKIKYEWLQYENINTEEQLEKELFEILNTLGDKYNINFKDIKQDEKVSNIFVQLLKFSFYSLINSALYCFSTYHIIL
jgi:transposase